MPDDSTPPPLSIWPAAERALVNNSELVSDPNGKSIGDCTTIEEEKKKKKEKGRNLHYRDKNNRECKQHLFHLFAFFKFPSPSPYKNKSAKKTTTSIPSTNSGTCNYSQPPPNWYPTIRFPAIRQEIDGNKKNALYNVCAVGINFFTSAFVFTLPVTVEPLISVVAFVFTLPVTVEPLISVAFIFRSTKTSSSTKLYRLYQIRGRYSLVKRAANPCHGGSCHLYNSLVSTKTSRAVRAVTFLLLCTLKSVDLLLLVYMVE